VRPCYSGGVADLQHSFSWSRSRDNLFHECRRKYFYHYYGSWGGWEADADEEIRRLYVLKQLQGRQMWAGKLVHEGVEWALRALRAGQEVSAEGLVGEIVRRMRREWKASKAREYQDRPKEGGLFEHEYGITIADSEWRAFRDLVMRCLRNFFRLDLLAEIRRVPREQWVLLEEIRAFDFEGTSIFAAPDFAYWTAEGHLMLVDWKTGAGKDDGATAFQLGCYALYAQTIWGLPPERLATVAVNLREPAVTRHPVDQASLDAVLDRLRLSIRAMRAWLRDPEANLAVMEDFEKTEELRICRWCNFRAVCRPEL